MLIPYNDINPTDRTPFINWLLIAMNVGAFIFVYLILFPSATGEKVQALMNSYHGCKPTVNVAATASTTDLYKTLFFYKYGLVPQNLEPITFFHSMFLHGGLMHLIGNMLFLWITGDNIEDRMGHFSFIIFYIVCGLAAAGAQILSNPDSCMPMIGASGAISGVMGAYMVLFPRSQIKIFYWFYFFIGRTLISAVLWLGLWILFQVFAGAQASGSGGGGVAYWAHIGGFVAGAGIAFFGKLLGFIEGGVNYTGGQKKWGGSSGRSRRSRDDYWGSSSRKRDRDWW